MRRFVILGFLLSLFSMHCVAQQTIRSTVSSDPGAAQCATMTGNYVHLSGGAYSANVTVTGGQGNGYVQGPTQFGCLDFSGFSGNASGYAASLTVKGSFSLATGTVTAEGAYLKVGATSLFQSTAPGYASGPWTTNLGSNVVLSGVKVRIFLYGIGGVGAASPGSAAASITDVYVTLTPLPTPSVSLSCAPSPGTYSSTVTCTTTFTPSTVTGTVQFKDGSTNLGSPVTVSSDGKATYSTTSLAVGTHSITSVYSGDANYRGVTSAAFSEVINKVTPSVVVSCLPSPVNYASSTTCTANVTPSTATGTIQFKDSSTNLGSAVGVASGRASYATNSLAVGIHPISAQYNGDSNCNRASAAPFSLTVRPGITALSKPSGPVGAFIDINGTGFGNDQALGGVTVSGISALVTHWSATKITIVIPADASSGPVQVTVSSIPSNSVNFIVAALPSCVVADNRVPRLRAVQKPPGISGTRCCSPDYRTTTDGSAIAASSAQQPEGD